MKNLSVHRKKLLTGLTISLIGYALIQKQKKANQNKRKWWVRPWLNNRNMGNGRGVLSMIENEVRHNDQENYKNFLRMDQDCFLKILNLIRSKIERKDTHLRQCISAEQRLSVTLRFLATGETFKSLSFATRIAHNTLSKIIPEVLTAIVDSMENQYLKVPSTKAEWESIATDFLNLWNFPNCLGALDGKHIVFRPPRSDGSFYRNYKGTDSIVLLALVDANSRFLCVDVGVNGRISDGGVFARSAMSSAIQNKNNTLNFPSNTPLPGCALAVPYVIVADDAFPLKERIMKPYRYRGLTNEQKVFNYRTSRARRVVENAFGRLSNRFRIFLQQINLSVEKVVLITKACCILHNFLTENKNSAFPTEEEECKMDSLCQQGGNKTAQWPAKVRQEFQRYFNTTGQVPWQQNSVENNNL